jgi:hypothetical protein
LDLNGLTMSTPRCLKYFSSRVRHCESVDARGCGDHSILSQRVGPSGHEPRPFPKAGCIHRQEREGHLPGYSANFRFQKLLRRLVCGLVLLLLATLLSSQRKEKSARADSYRYPSSALAPRSSAAASTANCSRARSASPRSRASFTPGITTAAYPVYSPGA